MTGEGSLFDVPPAAIGRFRVLHQIGAGTCGPVFRAMAPDGDTPVAIKLITTPLPPERARRAADNLSALAETAPRVPGWAAPLEAGLYAAQPYLVTAFAPGDALDVALRQFGPAPLADLVPRLEGLARVLDAAAAADIAHGALHPRDVLVAEVGTELTGLGLWPILVAEGLRLPIRRPYRAPEVADGILDAAGDRYALAALAFEWMTGRRVAPGAGFIDVPSIRGVDREALAALFTRALHDDPDERFATAGEFVSALAALAGDAVDDAPAVERRPRRRARGEAPMLPLDADAEADAAPSDEPLYGRVVEDEAAIDDGLPLHLADVPEAPLPLVDVDGVDDGDDVVEDVDVADDGVDGDAVRNELPVTSAFGPSAPPPSRPGALAMGGVLVAGLVLGLGLGYWAWGRDRTSAVTTEVADPVPPVIRMDPTAAPPAAATPTPIVDPQPVVSPPAPTSVPEPPATPPPAAPRQPPASSSPANSSPANRAPASRAPARKAPASKAAAPAPATTPPTASASRTGSLLIDSRPVGASVRLNGRVVGVTPVTVTDLAPGTYTVRMQLEGFEPLTTTVRVVAGARARAAASLTSAQEPQ